MQVLRICGILVAVVLVCSADSQSATNSSLTAQDSPPATNRTRRSGVVGLFNTKLHKKYALLGSLSSHHVPETTGPDYGEPLTYDHKAFSLWGFKKAIFSTLLQAIKAITGGVIALKGQIIKVKGHLIAAKGNLLTTKGEAISDFGRHIATKALLTPVHVPPSATGLSAFGHSGTGFGVTGYASGPPKPVYGPPPVHVSAPATGYGPPGPPSHPKPVYGPPPPSHSYGAPAKSPSSGYGAPPAPLPSAPSSSYGAPPPPLPSTSYGTPVTGGDPRHPSGGGDYSGPPPPSSSGSGPSSGGVYLPPSFPSAPSGPSAPSSAYGSPLKRDIKLPDGVQAGLLVLKPIQVSPSAFQRLPPAAPLPPH